MGNFVTGNPPLPTPKVDARPPIIPEQEIDAADVNNLWNAASDLRDAITGQSTIYTAPGTGAVARTLPSKLGETISVKDFGAKGDGATDDTAAINAAIVAATNKTLFFPPGTYLAKNVTVANQVRLEGASRSAVTLKLPVLAALDGSPILNITVGGVVVQRLGFDGQKASQPADGFSDSFNGGGSGQGRAYRALIRAYNAGAEIVGLIVEDCSLVNAYGAGIAAQNVSHAKIRRNLGNNNNFETIELYSTTAAGGATYYAGSEVVDNEITNTGSGDASINGNAIVLNHCTEFVVAHNYAQNIERNGLKCEGCKNGVVRGNVFDTITLGNFGGMQLQQDASNIVVDANKISNAGNGVNNGTVAGGTGFFNIVITNNIIDTTTGPTQGDGIAFTFPTTGTASSNIVISNNTMRAIQRIGINLTGLWTNVTINGNNIRTTAGGANGQYGMNIAATAAGCAGLSITNNLLDLNTAASSGAALTVGQSGGNTMARVTIFGNVVLNSGRTTITDGNAVVIASGVFGGNVTDGFIRMGSTGLQGVAPNAGGYTGTFQLAGVQMTAVTFANLGTPANGTVLYCSDATSPSNPATGAGTGALVVRQNGIWKAL